MISENEMKKESIDQMTGDDPLASEEGKSGKENGQLGCSIGSSLTLESLEGIHPETKHDINPVVMYQHIWINLRTIIRNAYTSWPSREQPTLQKAEIHEAVLEDMLAIGNYFRRQNKNVIWYCPTYEEIKTKYKLFKLREPTTPLQQNYFNMMEDVMKGLFKEDLKATSSASLLSNEVYRFDVKPSVSIRGATFMWTHYPYDLTNWQLFTKLALIESHTGNIKQRNEWYRKYHNSKDLPILPFNRTLLSIMGDKEMFAPLGRKAREIVINLAKTKKWNASTSEEYITRQLRSSDVVFSIL